MDREQYLLTIASEECNEVGQRCSKAIRFGLKEVQQGHDLNNAERIVHEFNDLVAVIQVLAEEGYIDKEFINNQLIEKKKENIEKWYMYAKSQGTITEL